MLNKIFIFSAFVMSAVAMNAQVPMTMANCPYQIGTQIESIIYEGQVKPPSFSTTGINNAWDFSYLATDQSYEYVMVVEGEDAIPCPDLSTLDNMVLSEFEPSLPNDVYYTIGRLDADSLTVLGDISSASICDFMVDGIKVFQFPFEYGDSYSDPYEYSDGFAYSFNSAYTAFGSIELPMGITYSEVALVQLVDEVYIQNIFYALDNGFYKMVLTLDNDGYYEFYNSTVTLNVSETPEVAMSLNPLGANTYQLQTNSNEQVQWSIVNALGQHVNAQTNGKNIDLNNLPVGIYIAQAKCGDTMETFKLQVR